MTPPRRPHPLQNQPGERDLPVRPSWRALGRARRAVGLPPAAPALNAVVLCGVLVVVTGAMFWNSQVGPGGTENGVAQAWRDAPPAMLAIWAGIVGFALALLATALVVASRQRRSSCARSAPTTTSEGWARPTTSCGGSCGSPRRGCTGSAGGR
ncbi:hypothetical protein [Litorihabitans aurantiacus]|uniref:Uncharacterized protein n=1 Tax=Litorihabitans aurantiacus TaxID=1930061 RepID=A0AA38CWB6_9MICO|nr:hypothetical protein [Litorihabitans aurantiacus]GMA32937.1 hypothetical protein GCM10025875_29290 [Litorihabitans aurantiacus]